VCPPRASSRPKSYREASSDGPFWALFPALGISPRGISGTPGSGAARHPLAQKRRVKKQIVVNERFIRCLTFMGFSSATELLSKWWLEEKSVIESQQHNQNETRWRNAPDKEGRS
jgi:hypothetical protein